MAWLNPEQTHEQYPPYNARLRCDGHGAWREDGRTVGFYLEYDTGTESQSVLLDKIEAYEQTTATGHLPPHPVLFWLPSTQREKKPLDRDREHQNQSATYPHRHRRPRHLNRRPTGQRDLGACQRSGEATTTGRTSRRRATADANIGASPRAP
ncbi:replication-relaxation family protein [Fodinicola feengrottensis]|uniref:replication-relaxation family protein n=1 Tax=Fodinicola feengrottensis TaxID=435914 RepID=UPI0036F1DA10